MASYNNGCEEIIELGPFDSCSTTCDLIIDFFSVLCNDNLTEVEASDDYYDITTVFDSTKLCLSKKS